MSHPTSRSTAPRSLRLPRLGRPLRLLTIAALAVGALAACGSGGPVAAPESSDSSTGPVPATDDTSSAATSAESGTAEEPTGPVVVATIPPSLPPELNGEIGEVEVIGTPLPQKSRTATVENDPSRGLKAPVLVGSTYSGDPIRIDPVETGRPTLVFFLAHWCPHCNREIPVINQLRDSNAFRPDLDIYGVSTGFDPTAPNWPASQWLKDIDWTYPTMVDGVIQDGDKQKYFAHESFGAGGYPVAVLLNADGTVAARWSGEVPGDQIIANIETYLAY